MFENMSKREKVLAAGVGAVAVLFAIFIGVTSFASRYQSGQSALSNVQKKIAAEKAKQLDALAARTRKKFFYVPNSFSAPSRKQKNVTDYQTWLSKLQVKCGFPRNVPKYRKELLKYKITGGGTGTIGSLFTFNFSVAEVTLDQVLEFTRRFENMNLLHKIKALTVKPVRDKRGQLTGICSATFSIELLALKDADESIDFIERSNDNSDETDEFTEKIVSRNIFGPANIPPKFKQLYKKKFTNQEDIVVSISAEDADDHELTFELVNNGGLNDAEFDFRRSRATFRHGKLENGQYEFLAKVIDNGSPPKSAEQLFKFEVTDPKPERRSEVAEKPKNVFRHAKETKITRISSRNGVFSAQVKVFTKGDIYNLKVVPDEKSTDRFELDGEQWVVREIARRLVTLESNNKRMEFGLGTPLSEPLTTENIESTDKASDETESVDSVTLATGE